MSTLDTVSSGSVIGARLLADLERDGIVRLPALVAEAQLTGMQTALAASLRRMRWNKTDGYERTELYRHMVEDVLTLDQGFVDVAIHPLVKAILREYIGDVFQLVEAKGWKSLPTRRDFHGWHGDAWYDQATIREIPREVKLALYLTGVTTGAFNYVVGSHCQQHPHVLTPEELRELPQSRIVEMTGPAGTAFLFDTSGIHRQGAPILAARQAIFYNYHDPAVRLQREDREGYRYHPLALNAAFLGSLTEEDRRTLGFGDKRTYVPAYERRSGQEMLETLSRLGVAMKLRMDILTNRVSGKLMQLARRRGTGVD